MAKGQNRGNREVKKPKKTKQPPAPSNGLQKGMPPSVGNLKKKP
ncbi:MAG TPA: hypothetical protein VIR45_06090 [Kiloniellaceae bacterium]